MHDAYRQFLNKKYISLINFQDQENLSFEFSASYQYFREIFISCLHLDLKIRKLVCFSKLLCFSIITSSQILFYLVVFWYKVLNLNWMFWEHFTVKMWIFTKSRQKNYNNNENVIGAFIYVYLFNNNMNVKPLQLVSCVCTLQKD